MLKKNSCILLLICIMVGMVLPVEASEQRGTVRICPHWCGTIVPGGTVTISRIGRKTARGVLLTDGLANWIVAEEDLLDVDGMDWLVERFGDSEWSSLVDEERGAFFDDLKEGVYLVRQTEASSDFREFAPFVVSIPEKNSWNILRSPQLVYTGESPRTGDRPAPIIGAMGVGLSVAFLIVLADEKRR